MASHFTIRATTPGDRDWIKPFITDHWGSSVVVAHGTTYFPHDLPGFVAADRESYVGLISYRIAEGSCEIVTLDSTRPGLGIGTALIGAVKDKAKKFGCARLWLVTTNDNLDALGFYQKRGFVLAKLYRDAVTEARRLKPSIPLYGIESIPIRDEIELEMML
ncbi:MAG: GNAT family N-acetyltransferase [Ignavibacteriae bacterium]|nr:GNAT family N-acetyltransferase [Ignavibacteriota bacterium]